MAQVEPFLEFDEDYVLDQYDQTVAYYKKSGQRTRPWSFGKIYKSMTGVYMLGGRKTRTPVGFKFKPYGFMDDADRKGLVLPGRPENRRADRKTGSGTRTSMCTPRLAHVLSSADQE